MKQIGIMGGTFDPPHMGHLMIAESVRTALELEEIRFIPTGKVAYKDNTFSVSPQDRLEMVRLAIEGNPYFRIDATEVERQGTTYTFETMELLTKAEPDAAFTFIVGADSLDYMERWRYPERIFDCCRVAAVMRPGFSKAQMEEKRQELIQRYDARIVLIEAPQISVSSTEIRRYLQKGDSVRYLIPACVEAYIKQRGLYR